MMAAKEYGYAPSYESHAPVLLNEVVRYLSPKKNEIYVDGTFGAGGYSRAILSAADCHVYGIDRDPYVKPFAAGLSRECEGRFTFLSGAFSSMEELLEQCGVNGVDGIVLDIGVSSMQLDTPRRGFSFLHDGPLDMRMSDEGETAADIVNSMEEEELAGILFRYGGERQSRRIAHALVMERNKGQITRTLQLADVVHRAVGSRHGQIDSATRTFQALRIYVNQELEELRRALNAAERLLKNGGRLVVVCFHSEEDRIVKEFLRERSGKTEGYSRYQPEPMQAAGNQPTFSLLVNRAVKPSDEEVKVNPRARSARLRAAARSGVPAWVEKEV